MTVGDLKRKLSSRKFWVGVAGWVTSLLTAYNFSENTIAQAAVIIAGIGSLAVYMLAEGMADKGSGMAEAAERLDDEAE